LREARENMFSKRFWGWDPLKVREKRTWFGLKTQRERVSAHQEKAKDKMKNPYYVIITHHYVIIWVR